MKYGWSMSLLACMTLANAEPLKLLPSELEMPDHIGPLTYTGKPNTWPDKRLGTAYAFEANGMKLDVYVYDAGVTDIPEGADSRAVCEEFEQAKLGVTHAGYKNTRLKSEQLARTGPTQERPLMREAVYEADIYDTPAVSYVWITGASKNFIKLRFSAARSFGDELVDARRAVLSTMGDAIRPHLGPAPAAPAATANDAKPDDSKKKGGASIVVNGSGLEDMTLGFIYLGAVAAAADKTPELRPACGGPVDLPFADEVGAYQAAVAFSEGDSGGSTYSKKLDAMSKAGYLEEFVWTYLHHDSWGNTPPDGLDLDAFRGWAKKNLKRLKIPTFGYVEYQEPVALPVEPL